MGLRLGDDPRVVATTTPRPVALVKRLVADAGTLVTRAGTRENAVHLAPGFLAAMEAAYGDSVLARQELGGELIADAPGALWDRAGLARALDRAVPERFARIVVGVDPPAGMGPGADACGIVAVGLDGEGGLWVLGDGSVQGLSPEGWAGRVAACAQAHCAVEIVAEANQGGEMVRSVLATAGCGAGLRLVRAKTSKLGRAMPVAALYGRGRVRHAGVFAALEDEMCRFGADGAGGAAGLGGGSGSGSGSPDRVDALVWAIWALALESVGVPRVRGV
jgi:phage terminase large subunit-like protein